MENSLDPVPNTQDSFQQAEPTQSPDPNPIPQIAMNSPHSTSKTTSILISIIVILLVLLGVTGYALLTNQSLPGLPAKQTANETPALQQVQTNSIELAYKKNFELWAFHADKTSTKLSELNQYISTFDQSPDRSVIAYIAGDKITDPTSNYTYVEPNAVYLYLSHTREVKKIYELTPGTYQNSDYRVVLKDIGISGDAKKIAITTSDSMYLYDVASGQTETLFSSPITNKTERGIVYSYLDPIFSPDNSKILFTRGYYEGGMQSIIDVTTKEIQRFEYSIYISGLKMIGWYDNNSVVAVEYGDASVSNVTATIRIGDPASIEQGAVVAQIDGAPDGYDVDAAHSALYLTTRYQKETGALLPDGKMRYTESYSDLYKLDLQAKKVQKLLSGKDDEFSPLGRIEISPDSKQAYIAGSKRVQNGANYSYTQLILNHVFGETSNPQLLLENAELF